MTDHPMLFSPPMILALLREAKEPGTGKTQTRRIIEQPRDGTDLSGTHWRFISGYKPTKAKQPYMEAVRPWGTIQPNGQPMGWEIVVAGRRVAARPGDRVWCRETWTHTGQGVWSIENARMSGRGGVRYRADHEILGARYFPSIFLPREFSRLTLYVSEVRVQRLQEISEADALAEGVCFDPSLPADVHRHWLDLDPSTKGADWLTDWSAKDVYRQLWEHLNGPGSWAENPFVAAYTFRPVLGNIDTLPATLET